MINNSESSREGLLRSVLAAYAILVLHLLLLAGIGLLVIFFGGIVRYLIWIVLGGVLLVVLSAYLFYRRMKREGKTLRELLRKPQFQGRSIEVGVLGGLITLKLGKPDHTNAIDYDNSGRLEQLEDPETVHIHEIAALGRLLEKELITPEEYDQAKRQLLAR